MKGTLQALMLLAVAAALRGAGPGLPAIPDALPGAASPQPAGTAPAPAPAPASASASAAPSGAPALPPPSAGDPGPMPAQDARAIRQLQAKAFGTPTVADGSDRGAAVLALGELASPAAAQDFSALDYDALFSLLQRYRDELLKMGVNGADLDARVRALKARADEIRERLDALQPRDGLKIHGRLYAFFDDMNLLGPAALPGIDQFCASCGAMVPVVPPKDAGSGLRFQQGGAHAEMDMQLIRGPLTADTRFDVLQPWGVATAQVGARELSLELRLPVALQAGTVFASLSPLTLWRNDQSMPFEPEPFADRRRRLEEDMDLRPDKWRLTGGRAATELVLFKGLKVDLEEIAALMAGASMSSSQGGSNVIYTNADASTLSEQYSTYLEAWKVALPLPYATVSEQGALFWDVTGTQPSGAPGLGADSRAFNELSQSLRVQAEAGAFKADVEGGLSSYAPPSLTDTAAPGALTGTAVTATLAWSLGSGQLSVFGRSVSAGYHASGAQGRTQDAAYEFLGPFPTENSQVSASGGIGLSGPGSPVSADAVPTSYATRFNDVLIPPGELWTAPDHSVTAPGGLWQNLLAYNYLENMDPYGVATPDRRGFGASGDWSPFDGLLRLRASYENFREIDSVADTSGAMTAPFTMQRLRAGLNIDLRKRLSLPVSLSAGYTLDDSRNGEADAAGVKYGLDSTLIDSGVEWYFGDKGGLDFGYRHVDANGFNETFDLQFDKGQTWDVLGYGAFWDFSEDMRLDLVYSQYYESAPGYSGTGLETDEGVIRATVKF